VKFSQGLVAVLLHEPVICRCQEGL
jgi:hypothetical protein